ncbi:MAG: polysaccharide deacetylase family protein [Bacillota bacterium]
MASRTRVAIGLCILLAVALAGVLAAGCALGGHLPGGVLARTGVTLEGQEVGGFDGEALHRLVAEMAKDRDVRPVNAAVDPRDQSAVPGLPGRRVDVAATEKAVMMARPRQAVALVSEAVPPEIGLDHFADLPIRHGHTARREVALTINVAWGEEPLAEILTILERAKVRATFFLVGTWAEDQPDLAAAIVRGGHELASHGYAHRHIKQLSPDQIKSEIERGTETVAKLTGNRPRIFSPPYGEIDGRGLDVAAQLGMRTIMWSADTVDWMRPGVGPIVERVKKRIGNGGIVLMHPVDQTAQALPQIIDYLTGQGYRLVTVSELIDESRPLAPGERASADGFFGRASR